MKSFFDFNSWTELEKRSRLVGATSVRQNPQEGVFCLLKDYGLRLELLGGKARQATRAAQSYASRKILEEVHSRMKTG